MKKPSAYIKNRIYWKIVEFGTPSNVSQCGVDYFMMVIISEAIRVALIFHSRVRIVLPVPNCRLNVGSFS